LIYLLNVATLENFDVVSFTYGDDAGQLHTGVPWDGADAAGTFGLQYGCGILELIKKRE
jgi:hypothetical protein